MLVLLYWGKEIDFALQIRTNVIHFKPAGQGFQVGIKALQGVKSVVKCV